MGRKVFVSYKYSDLNVRDLNLYSYDMWGNRVSITTTARHYVDELANHLEEGDNIFKGEDDGQSLAQFSDEHIASKLRDKIYDSTITIVLISKGMKNAWELEKDQWIPWEVSYSLRDSTRNGRTSYRNGVIMVVLPDILGQYDYYITNDLVCNCRSLNTDFLFQILKQNTFNVKVPNTSFCQNGSIVYHGDSSYIQTVKWTDFIKKTKYYLDKAIELRDKGHLYTIKKNLD